MLITLKSNCVVEPYNAWLATHWLLDQTEVSSVLDIAKLQMDCVRKVKYYRSSYDNLNGLIAKVTDKVK